MFRTGLHYIVPQVPYFRRPVVHVLHASLGHIEIHLIGYFECPSTTRGSGVRAKFQGSSLVLNYRKFPQVDAVQSVQTSSNIDFSSVCVA